MTRPDHDLHFLHVPGKGPNPTPLLLMHGWPGSVFEFLDFIPRLTDPASFGGDPADAFTVVAPSLPGYGLSFRPGQKRFGVEEMADMFRRAHDRYARLQALRRAGRRLGRHHRRAHGLRACGQADRHSRQFSRRPPRAGPDQESDSRAASLYRPAQSLAQGGRGLCVDSGHAPANSELWPDRFSGRSRGMDRREIPRLVGLRRRCRERLHPRPDARQHQLLLVHRRDRIVVLSLLLPACIGPG